MQESQSVKWKRQTSKQYLEYNAIFVKFCMFVKEIVDFSSSYCWWSSLGRRLWENFISCFSIFVLLDFYLLRKNDDKVFYIINRKNNAITILGKMCFIERIVFQSFQWMASLVAQTVKNLPAMWETWVRSLGWEDPLEEGMATHSSVLAWRNPVDRRAWWVTVHGAANSWTWLSN